MKIAFIGCGKLGLPCAEEIVKAPAFTISSAQGKPNLPHPINAIFIYYL